jgi:2-oxoglutarate ferredoxin oxidoreductase subunit beta
MVKTGFSFIEVISPCPTLYGRMNKQSQGLDTMHSYQERSIVRDGADPKDVDITFDGPIVVGKFIDIERPTFWDHYRQLLNRVGGKENQ